MCGTGGQMSCSNRSRRRPVPASAKNGRGGLCSRYFEMKRNEAKPILQATVQVVENQIVVGGNRMLLLSSLVRIDVWRLPA